MKKSWYHHLQYICMIMYINLFALYWHLYVRLCESVLKHKVYMATAVFASIDPFCSQISTEALNRPYKFSLHFIVELEATHWNIVASASSRPIQTYGPFRYIETIFPGIDVPVIKRRWSQPCPIFILGVPILVKSCLYIEKGPRKCVNIKTWSHHDRDSIMKKRGSHNHFVFILGILSLIAMFMGPTWGPSGAYRTQVGPMLTPWTLLSGVPCKS